ncbi:MAG: type II toxin-antitoxin system RelE/ParE family toxin [Nitrosomonadales bacterium]|nr:type II toxin-antitoxin system RelE/ParE family toxin [Nitrosomonadales bacterium]
MRQVVFRKQARRELDEAGDWYEKERAGLGMEFLAEIQNLTQRIANTPEQFPALYRDVRKAVARRFPYCIYFRERNQRIVVLAVFHSARNPAVWQQRA